MRARVELRSHEVEEGVWSQEHEEEEEDWRRRVGVCMEKGASGAPPTSPPKISNRMKKSLMDLVVIYYNLKIVKNLLRQLPKWSVFVRIFYQKKSVSLLYSTRTAAIATVTSSSPTSISSSPPSHGGGETLFPVAFSMMR